MNSKFNFKFKIFYIIILFSHSKIMESRKRKKIKKINIKTKLFNVFIYDSLMRGEVNHISMEHAEFIDHALTKNKYHFTYL